MDRSVKSVNSPMFVFLRKGAEFEICFDKLSLSNWKHKASKTSGYTGRKEPAIQ